MKTKSFDTKKTITVSTLLILTAAIIGCSGHKAWTGQQRSHGKQPPSKAQLFKKFDKDNDGKMSREEFPGPDAHFAQFDKNTDGYLEQNEMPDSPPPKK